MSVPPEQDGPPVFIICSLSDIPSRRAYGFNLIRQGEDGKDRPWPIIVVRWGRHVFGYVNRCPHHGEGLDWERDQFLDPYDGTRLMCGKHGALFDITNGDCIDGPCTGQGLEPIPLALIEDDICLIGIELAEGEEPSEEI